MDFTGDILIDQYDGESFDIKFENGQPLMTKGFSNLVYFLVMGEDCPYNAIVKNDNEKMKSEFPAIVKRAVVTDNILSRATDAIKKALQPLITWSIASTIEVFGEIISANRMGWQVEINKPDNETSKYFILWDKGVINFGNA